MKSVKCAKCNYVTFTESPCCKKCGVSYEVFKEFSKKVPEHQSEKKTASPAKNSLKSKIGNFCKQDLLKKTKYAAFSIIGIFILFNLIIYTNINPLAFGSGLFPIIWSTAGFFELFWGISFIHILNQKNEIGGWQFGLIELLVFTFGLILIFVLCMGISFLMDQSPKKVTPARQ